MALKFLSEVVPSPPSPRSLRAQNVIGEGAGPASGSSLVREISAGWV